MLPEILLYGKAGAGKDTVASILVRDYGAVALAMADPMKRLAAHLFGFSEATLWGPSSLRSVPDSRYSASGGEASGHWADVFDKIKPPTWEYDSSGFVTGWLEEVFGIPHTTARINLLNWAANLSRRATPDGISARVVLQTLGTEFGRRADDQLWIRYARRVQRQLLGGGWKYSQTGGLAAAPGQYYALAVVTDGRFRNEALEFAASGAKVVRVIDPATEAGDSSGGAAGHQSEREQDTVPDSWFDAVLFNRKADGVGALAGAVGSVVGRLTGKPYVSTTEYIDWARA